MGFSIYSNSGRVNYGIKHYTLDYDKDLNSLPTSITPGSSAFIVESSKKYILNNQHKWIEINNSNNSSNSETDTIIYDGNYDGTEGNEETDTIIFDGNS